MLSSFAIILQTLCSPNEDFGRMNKRWNTGFRLSFQRFVAQIESAHPWTVLRKSGFHLLSSVQNLRLGGVNLSQNYCMHISQAVFFQFWPIKLLQKHGNANRAAVQPRSRSRGREWLCVHVLEVLDDDLGFELSPHHGYVRSYLVH